MTLRKIKDSTYQQAIVAIKAASNGTVTAQPYDKDDRADVVAAGAALVLERTVPKLVSASYQVKADHYLEQGKQPWNSLQGSVARYIDTASNERNRFDTPGDGVGMVVSGVLQRVSSAKMRMALDNKELDSILNEGQLTLVQSARNNSELESDIRAISSNSLDQLSPEMSQSFEKSLFVLPEGHIGTEIAMISSVVDGVIETEHKAEVTLSEFVAAGRFSLISKEAMEAVKNFHKNDVSTGHQAIDDAFRILAKRGHVAPQINDDDPFMIAQARLVHEGYDLVTNDPARLASMAVSDAEIMASARKHFLGSNMQKENAQPQLASMGLGRYHELNQVGREEIERKIMLSQVTAPIERLRIGVAMLEIEQGDRAKQIEGIGETPKMMPENNSALLIMQAASMAQSQGR